MFLGHVCGSSLRRRVALKVADEDRKSSLQSHISQATAPLIASILGILLVLGFLFWSRATLDKVTVAREQKVEQKISALQAEEDKANSDGNPDKASDAHRKLKDAQFELEERTAAADYAESISSMNWPIFLLNITLAITAAAAAYLESKDRVQQIRRAELRGDQPFTQPLSAALLKQSEIRIRMMQNRMKIQDLDGSIRTNLGRAKYLSHSNPFQDWEAKSTRLNAIIHIFRTTNACLRGLDAINIRAFDMRRPLDLVPVEGENFKVADDLAQCDRDFAEASAEANRMLAKTTELMGVQA